MGLTGIIWAIRQEGRINGHDTLFVERQKTADDRHGETKGALVRIEQKIDKLIDDLRRD